MENGFRRNPLTSVSMAKPRRWSVSELINFNSCINRFLRSTDIQGILDGTVALYTTPPKKYVSSVESQLATSFPHEVAKELEETAEQHDVEDHSSTMPQEQHTIQFGE